MIVKTLLVITGINGTNKLNTLILHKEKVLKIQ